MNWPKGMQQVRASNALFPFRLRAGTLPCNLELESFRHRVLVWISLLLSLVSVLAVVTGCASRVVNHAFSFDTVSDSPGHIVIQYRYGNSKLPPARSDQFNRIQYSANVNGEMLRGEELYVKWQIEKTGEIYENSVNLKSVLPDNIRDHRIHFVVDGPRLLVYLVMPERRPEDWPISGPRIYRYNKVVTLSSSIGVKLN